MSTAITYPKRLIEVDLPIKRISTHSRREKSIRHGHISTMHLWWARRPLAACRAVICASLWPDPADPICPESFRRAAKIQIKRFAKDHIGLLGEESFSRFVAYQKNPILLDDNLVLRSALLDFSADFSNWDNSNNRDYLNTVHSLTQAAHEALGGNKGSRPLVVDPFTGGGSIPLEALRVGADAFASDLNPVPVLLNKVLLEYIPKYGLNLATAVRKWGSWVNREADKELAAFFPTDIDGERPIAYLWARTILCEGPGCGVEVPLIRSLWLAKRTNRSQAIQLLPNPSAMRIDVQIIVKGSDGWVEQSNPKNKVPNPEFRGTVKRGSGTCPCCGYTTPVARVREQLKLRSGGARDARLLCVVTTRTNEQGRFYRSATNRDVECVRMAKEEMERQQSLHKGSVSLVPDETLPLMSGVFNAPLYGHTTWGSLFTPRQALALTTLGRLTRKAADLIAAEEDPGFAKAIRTCLALVADRQADYSSSLCRWVAGGEFIASTFGRQAIPMLWDFCEVFPLSESTGGFPGACEWVSAVLERESAAIVVAGHVENASATRHPLPDDSAHALITDPPYYNAVPYADLSDFFVVWLSRTLGETYPELFTTTLSPKDEEACQMSGWDPERYPHKDAKWFETQMYTAMAEARRVLAPDGIGVVVFAHKSTSGWEAQLQAMIKAGWVVTGSWPIDTERGSRMRAHDSAALASSVHLVCRPRENADGSIHTDEIGDWREVLTELPKRIHEWMPRLAEEGVVGADAIFACLGPALEIFSRFSSVEKASGESVSLREYLEYVWSAVAKEALSMVFQGASADGFEPDSRLTAMWLWTMSNGGTEVGEDVNEEDSEEGEEDGSSKKISKAGFLLEFDAARKISQGLGADLTDLKSLVEINGETARLLPVGERAAYLFGKEAVQPLTNKPRGRQKQQALPGFEEIVEEASGFGLTGAGKATIGRTVLDRVHQAMLLFGTGRSEALKTFLVDEGVGNDVRFWRLAQALSALYPRLLQEKRWVDGVLARKKGLGF